MNRQAQKNNSFFLMIKKILISAVLLALVTSLGISIYQNIRFRQLQKNEISYLAKQADRVTEESLTIHRITLKSNENGFYYTTARGGSLLFSRYFAPYVTGYGGPIELLVHLDSADCIRKIHLLKHQETPLWIDKIAGWLQSLQGSRLIEVDPLEHVDTVTGATVTCKAILKILKKTGRQFYHIRHNKQLTETRSPLLSYVHFPFVVLLCLLSLSIVLRINPRRPIRLVFMALVVIVTGIWLNLQLSSYHIINLAAFAVFIRGLDINFFFFIVLPIALILLGNIYCGYLCPFGLLQELVHELFYFIHIKIPSLIDETARLFRYILLILILLSPLIKPLKLFARLDILLLAFDWSSKSIFLIVMLFLLLSIFFNRFWCKYLCPTGAFLSLFHGISLFVYQKWGKKLPVLKKNYYIPDLRKCDLGVQKVTDINCICCDRCRYCKPDLNPVYAFTFRKIISRLKKSK